MGYVFLRLFFKYSQYKDIILIVLQTPQFLHSSDAILIFSNSGNHTVFFQFHITNFADVIDIISSYHLHK